MGVVVSVINYKGGVGKTTVTSNLAAYVASEGKRVLVIDVDPQTNLTLSFIEYEEWFNKYCPGKTLKDYFKPIVEEGKKKILLKDLIIPLTVEGIKIDIISSHLELIDIDNDLAANLPALNMPMLATNYLEVHNYFREEIIELKKEYDLILIDCPPSFGIITKNVLVSSDKYLAPSKMDFLSTFGVSQLTRNVDTFIKKYNNYMQTEKNPSKAAPDFLGVVATMVKFYAGQLSAPHMTYLNNLHKLNIKTFDTYIRESGDFAGAVHIPLFLSKPRSAFCDDLRKLGKKFMEKAMV